MDLLSQEVLPENYFITEEPYYESVADEVVEARKDITVVIHPLADDRRVLPMEKRDVILQADNQFCLQIML